MTVEHDRLEAQIAQVFGLTGGELQDEPLIVTLSDGSPGGARFWYEGYPDYAAEDFDGSEHDYLTVVLNRTYASAWTDVNEMVRDGRTWKVAKVFTSSGETECPGRNAEDKIVTADHFPDDEGYCALCGARMGEEHGHIYIGDGWAEVVYRSPSEG